LSTELIDRKCLVLSHRARHDGVEFETRSPSVFFRRVQPMGMMFHRPTFQHRLFLGQVSPILLDMMYAFASRLSAHPALLATSPLSQPASTRGELLAERAHNSLKRALSVRSSWSEEAKMLDRGTYEETELIQAMLLASVYYSTITTITSPSSGQSATSRGIYYLDLCISFLRPATSATLLPPANHLPISTPEYLTLNEIRHRTFWLIVLHDLCISSNATPNNLDITSQSNGNSNGRARRLADHEIYNIPLPGDDLLWNRYGGVASNGRDAGRRDGLAVGTGNWAGDEGAVGEMGHVLRIVSIQVGRCLARQRSSEQLLIIDAHILRNHGGVERDRRKECRNTRAGPEGG
jgi:hypothetical protein